MTRGQTIAADVAALLRSRNALLWVVTREEARVEALLFEAAAAANYVPRTWDAAAGVCAIGGQPDKAFQSPDLDSVLTTIGERSRVAIAGRGVWIMRDLPVWVGGGLGGATTLRRVRNLARSLPAAPRDSAQALIVLSPDGNVPAELASHATVIEWPLPDREEIGALLDATVGSLPDEIKSVAMLNGTRDEAIAAAIGLTGEETQSCFAKSLVLFRRIDPKAIAGEKKRVIAREKVLEWYDPIPGGLEAVGGLDALKTWLVSRSSAYSPAARAYGLPAPRGAMLVGVPGCGKSLTAKAVATAWGIPLLRLDLGSLQSKFVGESQGNLRKALRVIEAIGRCVVWLDEIEKALAGATQGAADGGVSADALGTILSWMQERAGEAFVIATANDVSGLPPELLRKGRFDEVWFVDLPNLDEREAVLAAALKSHGRQLENLGVIAEVCDSFTGSEIAAIVPDAMFQAFADGQREISLSDLADAARSVVPLAKTAAEKITTLRAWATGRARHATTAQKATPARTIRVLDIYGNGQSA
jgi:hypothetical protein